MEIIIGIVNCVILLFLFYKHSRTNLFLTYIYWPALIIKLVAGILLGLLYTYYYSVADTFGFFEDATKFSALAKEDIVNYLSFIWTSDESYPFWSNLNYTQPRAVFLSKIVSFFCLITGDNYWLISLYFSFIAFACSWRLVNTIITHYPESKIAAIISFLFVPSVVFWSSGLVKECLAMGALFYISSVFLKVWHRDKINITEVLLTILSLWILWQLKYYYAAVFLPVLFTSIIVKFILVPVFKIKSSILEIVIWFSVFAVPLFLISLSKENFHLDVFFEVIVKNYHSFQNLSSENGAVHFNDLQPNFLSILYNAPWALVSGLFRPFLWEVDNLLQVLQSVESAILFILVITSVMNFIKGYHSKHRLLILSLMVYVVLLCIFLTISSPNFGTLSRYRIGFLPFLFFLLLIDNAVVTSLSEFIQSSVARLVR